jgi:hypothetical protein
MNNADEFSQATKRKILTEDRQRFNTYRSHAEANADLELGGRFSKVTTVTVTGARPAIQYPRQPLNSPANQMAMMPPEQSLGYDINEMECVGEPHERDGTPPSPAAVELEHVAPPVGDWRRAAKRWRRL